MLARVSRLRQITASINAPLTTEDRRTLSFATIELDNLIIVGLRQYAKSSLLGARTAAGVRITSSINPRTTEEAAAFIFKSLNPAGFLKAKSPAAIKEKDEKAFRDPRRVEKILSDYAVSNLGNIILALSLNADAFDEVKIPRHFFAHRARNTYDVVQNFASNLAITGFESPEDLLLRGRPSTGVRILDGWMADVENFFDLAA